MCVPRGARTSRPHSRTRTESVSGGSESGAAEGQQADRTGPRSHPRGLPTRRGFSHHRPNRSSACTTNSYVGEGARASWGEPPVCTSRKRRREPVANAFRRVSGVIHGRMVLDRNRFRQPLWCGPAAECGFRVNRFEAQVRHDLAACLARWITNPKDLRAAVDALMSDLLWWPDPPGEADMDPESRVRRPHPWRWDEVPTILHRLIQAKGGREGDSFNLKKYQRGTRKRVRALVEAECARNGGDIIAACKQLADKKSDSTLYPLKADTIRTYYREDIRRDRDSQK